MSQVTDRVAKTKAKVKNISTCLAAKIAEVRTRTNAPGSIDDAPAQRAARVPDGIGPTLSEASDTTASTSSTKAAFTFTAAAVTGQLGQARASFTGHAAQCTARTRLNSRSALPAVGVVVAGVVVTWVARRVIGRLDPVLERA